MLAAWWFSRAGKTVIELVNQVGSLVYGPMLAVFLLAWFSRRADGRSAVAGALAGLVVNLALASFVPSVSWLWWNLAGRLESAKSSLGQNSNRKFKKYNLRARCARGEFLTLLVSLFHHLHSSQSINSATLA